MRRRTRGTRETRENNNQLPTTINRQLLTTNYQLPITHTLHESTSYWR
ncbi:hypothetical protein [Chroococcidiopsis sp. CCALA 051]|nr:hypothetical protein [Chroococcidiopsis sp. CCALA 051]